MQNTAKVRDREEVQLNWRQYGLRVLSGLAVALILTFAVLLLLAALLFYLNVGSSWAAPVATVFALLALFFGAKIAAKGLQGRGFVLGAIVGILYYIFIYILSVLLFSQFTFTVQTASFMLIGALTGCIGGAAGQNAPEQKPKKRKKKK